MVTRRLTLWANGFNIDDGPLMDYQQHAEVLRDLNSGRAPLELLNVKFGQRVDLQVQKRLEEPFVPEKVAAKPFGGEGNRLGAPAPALGAAAASTSQQAPAAPANPAPSSTSFEVNASQPVTSIQIRLGNGDRLVPYARSRLCDIQVAKADGFTTTGWWAVSTTPTPWAMSWATSMRASLFALWF